MRPPRTQLPRGRLSERAYSHIRDGILRGDYPVGTVLAEGEVATAIGSSRTPVRQALSLLLQEGLVEVGPRRQLIVRGLTQAHRDEILLLREALEGVAVARACDVMTMEEIDYLRLLLIRQRRVASEGRDDEFIDLDEEFHLKIAEGAGMPILHGYLSQLRGFVRLLRLRTPRLPRELLQVVREHEEIVDALETRDVDAASSALHRHLHSRSYVVAARASRRGAK